MSSGGLFIKGQKGPKGPKFTLLVIEILEYLRPERSPAARRCACFFFTFAINLLVIVFIQQLLVRFTLNESPCLINMSHVGP